MALLNRSKKVVIFCRTCHKVIGHILSTLSPRVTRETGDT